MTKTNRETTPRVFDVEIIEAIIAQDEQRGPTVFGAGVAEQAEAKAG